MKFPSNEWLRRKIESDPNEPEGCPVCGAIAGACSNYPSCPGGTMTIKVTVTNSDTRETAVISVKERSPDPKYSPMSEYTLKGGESKEVWVHSGQQVIVEEVSQ